MIIGITGLYQSGKDTTAETLIKEYGFTRFSFADELKAMARDHFGWDGTKTTEERQKLIRLGKAGRDYDENFWVKIVDMKMSLLHVVQGKDNFVVPDVRFENEYRWIKNNSGQLWMVERQIDRNPIILSTDSEQFAQTKAKKLCDFYIDNNGSREELDTKIIQRMGDRP